MAELNARIDEMRDIKTQKIAIIYWGFRGGGKDLAELLIKTSLAHNVSASWSTRAFAANPQILQAPQKIFSIFDWLGFRRRIGKTLEELKIELVILPMTSPWDLMLGRKLMKSGIKVIRIIHDAKPHPGDYWPNKSWIRWVCLDADRLVFLSKFVADEVFNRIELGSREIMIKNLPTPVIPLKMKFSESSFEYPKEKPQKKVLFLGRGKKYKGLKLLQESWLLINDSSVSLTILGKGHKVRTGLPRTTHKAGWASNETLVEEIMSHDLIVLPYIEASQSGIIPLCHSLGKPVVVTPVGGLTEQIKDGTNGLVSPSMSATDLARCLEKGLSMRWPFENFKSQNSEAAFFFDIIS
jgi:glycosyltransferase involved in cell wall biosynthesis